MLDAVDVLYYDISSFRKRNRTQFGGSRPASSLALFVCRPVCYIRDKIASNTTLWVGGVLTVRTGWRQSKGLETKAARTRSREDWHWWYMWCTAHGRLSLDGEGEDHQWHIGD